MQINNPRYNANSTIDCEVEHPIHGMIPYTASSETQAEFGKSVWIQLQEMDVAAYVPPTDAEKLEAAQQRALAQLNADYEAQAKPLIRDYPEAERLSWPNQLAEAEAYRAWLDSDQSSDAPATPILSGILAGRNSGGDGETMEELTEAVIARAEAFQQWQWYTGLRQRGEKLIKAAQTPDEAEAVTWESLAPSQPV